MYVFFFVLTFAPQIYVMNRSFTKGFVLIVNNHSFPKERKGSEIDLANVQHVFKEIGYYPIIQENLTANVSD